MRVAERGLPPLLRQAGVTRREADVLEALADRLSNRQIAQQLVLSVRTIESHVSSLMSKLQAADRNELSLIARTVVVGPATSGRMPLSLLELTERGPLIGRQHELTLLRELWADAVSGRPRVVFVVGEAGIGKSRLLAELALAADRQGSLVALGHCDEQPLTPYQPFIEAISAIVETLTPEEVGAIPQGIGPELAALVPALSRFVTRSGSTQSDPPATARFRLFEQLAGVVLTAGQNTPLLLALEDLQWADPTVLQMIKHTLRRAGRTRLFVVGTVRGTQMDGPQRQLAEELRRDAGGRFVSLGGLNVREVAQLIEAHPKTAAPAEQLSGLAQQLHDETGGNPFFIEELLDLMAQSGGLQRGTTRTQVPTTVRDLILRRASALADTTRETLSIAAVLGRRFRVDHLLRTADVDDAQTMSVLDAAQAAGLVSGTSDRPGWMHFAHALVRETLEAELAARHRQQLHRRIAAILEAEDPIGHAAEIARHLHAAAVAQDHQRAVHYAVAAAEEATRRLAHEVAAELYGMALDALALAPTTDHLRQFELLLRTVEAHQRSGVQDRARQAAALALALAQRLDDPLRMADAALAMAASASTWPDDPQLVDALRTALTRIPDADLRRRALLLARLAQAEYYSTPALARGAYSDQAVALARRSGDDITLATVLSTRHALLWGPSDTYERLAIAAEIVAIGRRLDDDELTLQGYGWQVIDLLEIGDVSAVNAAMKAHAALARIRGGPLHVRDAALWSYTLSLLEGQFAEAERQSGRAFMLGQRVGDQHAEMFRSVQRLWVTLEQDASRDEFADVIAETSAMAQRYAHVPAWRAKLALLHARLGEHDAAAALFEQLSVRQFAGLPRDAVWIGGLYYLAEVAAFLGDRAAARTLYDLLLPFASRVVVVDRALVCLGSVSRALGLLAETLGDEAVAREHLGHALTVHDAMGARPLTARTRFELARLRRSGAGDEPDVIEELAQARSTASELGMHRLVDQIDSFRG